VTFRTQHGGRERGELTRDELLSLHRRNDTYGRAHPLGRPFGRRRQYFSAASLRLVFCCLRRRRGRTHIDPKRPLSLIRRHCIGVARCRGTLRPTPVAPSSPPRRGTPSPLSIEANGTPKRYLHLHHWDGPGEKYSNSGLVHSWRSIRNQCRRSLD